MKHLAIIGAGGWGTALSILCESMSRNRVNTAYLPGFLIPHNVQPTRDIATALEGAEVVILAIPSRHLRNVCGQMRESVHQQPILVSAAKGLERGTLLRMTEVVRETLGGDQVLRLAALSGPTFAREVAHGSPAALVVASEDADLAVSLQKNISTPAFRLYSNTDVVGVELGGAIKNVIAIAAGVCEGMELGSNAVAAVITRGLAEVTRLACACGARRETLTGLAGLGDLVLTCTGPLSRNRSAGVELGRGRTLQEIVSGSRMAIEGIDTAAATLELAHRHKVEMPITERVAAMLFSNRPPGEALRELMERRLKAEY
jgi:glycerol-3-phosphate dehydrogenase (NAD(P)+)